MTPWKYCSMDQDGNQSFSYGRIRMSVSEGEPYRSQRNRTYEHARITDVTPFCIYEKYSTGPSTYGPWVRTCNKMFFCKPVLMVCNLLVAQPHRMKYIHMEECHMGHLAKFVDTTCCTCGKLNTTIAGNALWTLHTHSIQCFSDGFIAKHRQYFMMEPENIASMIWYIATW